MNSDQVRLVQFCVFFSSQPEPNQPRRVRIGSSQVSVYSLNKEKWTIRRKKVEKSGKIGAIERTELASKNRRGNRFNNQ